MKHLVSRELHCYWNRLRGSRAAPERSDLDPGAIRSILADTLLAEIVSGGAARERDAVVRLSGTRLNALFGADLNGRSLLSIWQDEDRSSFSDLIDLVLDDQTPVVAGARAFVDDETSVDVEMLLLPLRHHGETHARLLGSIAPHYVPNWLGARPVRGLALRSFRSIEGTARSGFRNPAPALFKRTAAPMSYGRFTVHQGGR